MLVIYEREFREEAGGSRLKWTRHVERLEGERLTKTADALRVEWSRRRTKQIIRWEKCVKKYLAGVGGERRTRARDRVWVETVGGEGTETRSVTKKKGKKSRPVSVPPSPRTTEIKTRATTIILKRH